MVSTIVISVSLASAARDTSSARLVLRRCVLSVLVGAFGSKTPPTAGTKRASRRSKANTQSRVGHEADGGRHGRVRLLRPQPAETTVACFFLNF